MYVTRSIFILDSDGPEGQKPRNIFLIGEALAIGTSHWEKSRVGKKNCSNSFWALVSYSTVPLFSQDNGSTLWGPWVVAEGPWGTHWICPAAPCQKQAGDLLLRVPGKLLQGAGAAGREGPPYNLRGPVGSGVGVHAAQPGKAPAPTGWHISAKTGLG